MKRILLATIAAVVLPLGAVAPAAAPAGAPALSALAVKGAEPAGQCNQRVGPFATQTTAWRRWRQARYAGYSVSNGVTPCYDGGYRGYCFFAFYSC